MTEPIKGKVAQILTKYELALNIGSEKGVVKGMMFSVYSYPVPLLDPDTNEEIGKISVETNRVEAYEVHKRYSLARTSIPSATVALPYPTLFRQSSRKKLSVDPDTVKESMATIKVGSSVVQIVDEK